MSDLQAALMAIYIAGMLIFGIRGLTTRYHIYEEEANKAPIPRVLCDLITVMLIALWPLSLFLAWKRGKDK